MKRYRILHILHSMNRGGAETLVMNLFRAIDRDRYAFDFLLCTGRNDYGEEITRLGIAQSGVYSRIGDAHDDIGFNLSISNSTR